jgi:uncharacterized oxidoreductase
MHLSDNTILLTGGSSGIGLALAERLLALGIEVVICGRRADALEAARQHLPRLHVQVADTGAEADRSRLVDTLSLRQQLAGTSVEVIEMVPPAVVSNLGGKHDFGVPTAEYADSVIAQLREGRPELTYGLSAKTSQASRAELDQMFEQMNRR